MPTKGERAARIALRALGIPYRWGGESLTSGFDCSGLVRWAYRGVGVDLPHSSYALYGEGRRVERARMRTAISSSSRGSGTSASTSGGAEWCMPPQTGRSVEIVRLARSNYGRSRGPSAGPADVASNATRSPRSASPRREAAARVSHRQLRALPNLHLLAQRGATSRQPCVGGGHRQEGGLDEYCARRSGRGLEGVGGSSRLSRGGSRPHPDPATAARPRPRRRTRVVLEDDFTARPR